MPHTSQYEGDENIQVLPEDPFPVPTQGNIHIIPEPGTQGNMPAPPVVSDADYPYTFNTSRAEVRLTFYCQFFKNMTCIFTIPFLLKDKLQGVLQVTAVFPSKWSVNPLTYLDTLLKTLSVSPYRREFGPRLFLGQA